jgi:hypothetical protein
MRLGQRSSVTDWRGGPGVNHQAISPPDPLCAPYINHQAAWLPTNDRCSSLSRPLLRRSPRLRRLRAAAVHTRLISRSLYEQPRIPQRTTTTTATATTATTTMLVLAASAVTLAGLLLGAPAPVAALVAAPGGAELGHLAARHLAGVSPNHPALARRKRNVHKNRKRCVQRPTIAVSAQQPNTGDNNSTPSNAGDSNSNSNNTPAPAPSNPSPPPTVNSGDSKLMVAYNAAFSTIFTGKVK